MNIRHWGTASAMLVIGAVLVAGCAASGSEKAAGTGGGAARKVTLHVHGLDSQAAEDAVRRVLQKQSGVGSITADRAAGRVSFTLAAPGSVERVVSALADAGYTAHEGDDEKAEHPEHPKESEHPEHPKEPEHPEHPK